MCAEDEFTPATYNNPELTKRVTASLKAAVGDANVLPGKPDDGRRRLLRVQSARSFRPCVHVQRRRRRSREISPEAKKAGTPLPSLHSSKFAPVPEPTIRTGVIGDDERGARLDEEVAALRRDRYGARFRLMTTA